MNPNGARFVLNLSHKVGKHKGEEEEDEGVEGFRSGQTDRPADGEKDRQTDRQTKERLCCKKRGEGERQLIAAENIALLADVLCATRVRVAYDES